MHLLCATDILAPLGALSAQILPVHALKRIGRSAAEIAFVSRRYTHRPKELLCCVHVQGYLAHKRTPTPL